MSAPSAPITTKQVPGNTRNVGMLNLQMARGSADPRPSIVNDYERIRDRINLTGFMRVSPLIHLGGEAK